jgi:regulator of protease activity HflC (stomatin/prohibitin superfamily)
MELVGDKRPEINQKIFEAFRNDLEEYGIVIETFNLSDVVPDEATATAIQNVVNAQNALLQSKIEKEQAEVEAEKARVAAKGKADAALIEAEGQAQANAKLQQSLTANVLQQRAIEKWNGELPKIGGGSGSFLLSADFLK